MSYNKVVEKDLKSAFLLCELNDKKLTVDKKYFYIKAKVNYGTGYSWYVVLPDNQKILKYDGILEVDESNSEIERILGSEDWEYHIFKVLKKGELDIIFKYIKIWEKDKKPEREIRFRVIVKK